MTDLRKTPLFDRHVELGAKMVPFAGWSMPVQYHSIVKEHEKVRSAMGLFDVSHMGEIEISGKASLEFCQHVSTNNVAALKPGRVQYTTILNENGGIIDDCTLYCLADDRFLFVVNAARKDEVLKWFQDHKIEGATIDDHSEKYALLALQGKNTNDLIAQVTGRDMNTVNYYESTWTNIDEAAVLLSRTGYTGEDGFELYVPWDRVVGIWDKLMDAGKTNGLEPIGLGARDTLRLEMGYLLYGNDMDHTISPLEARLSWVVMMDKGQFIGKKALLELKRKGISKRLKAFRMVERGIPRHGYPIRVDGEEAGHVTSGTFSPTKKMGIGMGYVSKNVKIGETVEIVIREKPCKAEIIKPPFVEGSVRK